MANNRVIVWHKSKTGNFFPPHCQNSCPTWAFPSPPFQTQQPISCAWLTRSVGATMKHLPCLLLLFPLTFSQVSFGNGQHQRPRPRPPLSRPPPGGRPPPLEGRPGGGRPPRPPLEGRPPRPFQPGSGRPPRPVGFPDSPPPQQPFQGQSPFQEQGGQFGQRTNLGQPGSGDRPENQKPTTGKGTIHRR